MENNKILEAKGPAQDTEKKGSIRFFDEDSIKPNKIERFDTMGLFGIKQDDPRIFNKIDFKNRNTFRNHKKWLEDNATLYDFTEAARKEYARQFGDNADLLKEGLNKLSPYADRQSRRDFLNDYLRHYLGQSYDDQADEIHRFSSHYFNLPDEADEDFESWKKDYDKQVEKFSLSKQSKFNDREKEYLKNMDPFSSFLPEPTLRMFNKKRKERGEPLLNLADFGYKE